MGKHDTDKNDGNIVGCASSVEHHAEDLACSKQVGGSCMQNKCEQPGDGRYAEENIFNQLKENGDMQ